MKPTIGRNQKKLCKNEMGYDSPAIYGAMCCGGRSAGELIGGGQLSDIYFGKSTILMDFQLNLFFCSLCRSHNILFSNTKSLCWAFGIWFSSVLLFVRFVLEHVTDKIWANFRIAQRSYYETIE